MLMLQKKHYITFTDFSRAIHEFGGLLPQRARSVILATDWARKVYENAQIDYYTSESDQFVGLAAYYCNNGLTGFLTLILVSPNWQGRGFSKEILTNALSECSRRNLQFLELECDNENWKAERLYRSMGGLELHAGDAVRRFRFDLKSFTVPVSEQK